MPSKRTQAKGLILPNNIRYADDTVLIADTEEKLQELLQKVAKESAGKGLSINYKKTECMVISKKTNQKCTLQVYHSVNHSCL